MKVKIPYSRFRSLRIVKFYYVQVQLHLHKSLQRSGVGPAELLKSLDIPVVQDLPGVGETCKTIWKCTYNISAKTGQLISGIEMV